MKIQIKPQKININIKTGKVYPELENLEIEPRREKQTFKSEKYGYNEVTINAVDSSIDENIKPEYIKKDIEILGVNGTFEAKVLLQDKTITKNGEYTADEGYDGLGKVNVDVKEEDSAKYDFSLSSKFVEAITDISDVVRDGKCEYMFDGCKNLKNIKQITLTNCTSTAYMFRYCTSLESIPEFDCTENTNIIGMFQGCTRLTKIPIKITNKIKSADNVFNSCKALTSIPEDWDFSGIARAEGIFAMSGLVSCKKLNLSNSTTSGRMLFQYCNSLISCSNIDLRNTTQMASTFYDCKNLTDVGEIRSDKVESWMYPFSGCTKLVNFGGFLNAGMSYSTRSSENNSSYTVRVSDAPNLSHDSLMNIINKLYDIKTKGCKAQRLQLGSTNLAKLTEEEIAIATNKGFNVS